MSVKVKLVMRNAAPMAFGLGTAIQISVVSTRLTWIKT